MNLSICTYNVRNAKNSISYVYDLLRDHKILFLIEHWLAAEEGHLLTKLSQNHNAIFEAEFSDSDRIRGRPFGGTCWFVEKSLQVTRCTRYDRHLSVIEVKPTIGGQQLVVYGVWFPFDDGRAETWAQICILFSQLESLIRLHPPEQPFLLIGDWNFDLNRGKRGDRRLDEFILECNLVVCDRMFAQVPQVWTKIGLD